jgi:hypothetical protein
VSVLAFETAASSSIPGEGLMIDTTDLRVLFICKVIVKINNQDSKKMAEALSLYTVLFDNKSLKFKTLDLSSKLSAL